MTTYIVEATIYIPMVSVEATSPEDAENILSDMFQDLILTELGAQCFQSNFIVTSENDREGSE